MAGLITLGGGGETDIEKGIVEKSTTEEKVNQREFFWDKIATYLSSILLALAALDVFSQLLRGDSGVACDFSAQEDNLSDATVQYVLSLCSRDLPPVNFLPTIIAVQAIILVGPHYVWKALFSSQFDYFFSLAGLLRPLRNKNTGHYPQENKVIIQQLYESFMIYNRSDVFLWYKIKLFFQLFLAFVSIFTIAIPKIFRDGDTDFSCTFNLLGINSEQITCVITSVQLFRLIWVCDLVLLALILPLIGWGCLWCFLRHTSELGHKDIATFSFNSSIPPNLAAPKSRLSNLFHALTSASSCHREFSDRFLHPRIKSDLDFMIVSLHQAHSGLGNVFREGQVELEMERLFVIDQQLLDSHIRRHEDTTLIQQGSHEEEDEIEEGDDRALRLGWNYPAEVYEMFNKLDYGTKLHIPRQIRGAVMGFSLRASNNVLAMEIGFGSMYSTYSLAIARTFQKVGYINFDPSFRPVLPTDNDNDEENDLEVSPEGEEEVSPCIIEVEEYSTNITAYRVQDNIYSQDAKIQNKFRKEIEPLWKVNETLQFKISYIVINPIVKKEHKTAAKTFLESLERHLDEGAVLLTVRPLKIEGKETHKYFHKFIPPGLGRSFIPLSHNVEVTNRDLTWPLSSSTNPSQPPNPVPSHFTVHCGNSECVMELIEYVRRT